MSVTLALGLFVYGRRLGMAEQHTSQRASVLRALFGVLYRNRTLYWLASTIPFAGQWRRWQRL